MSRRTKQLVTAAAVTTVIAVAAALVVLVPRYLHRQITVHAHFKDAVGLYSGNAVSVLGMQVGSVSRIESMGDHVEVTMKLDRDIPIPADVTAVTVSASLLTDRHIELTPPYTDGPRLLDGDLVPIGHTRTPVEFDKTLSMMNKLGSALRGDDRGSGPLGDLVNLGSQISAGNGEKIKSTLDKLSDALRVGPDGGDRTSKNIQEIVRGVAERDVTADLAVWTLSYSASAGDLAGAQAKVDRDTQSIRSFFTELGFPAGSPILGGLPGDLGDQARQGAGHGVAWPAGRRAGRFAGLDAAWEHRSRGGSFYGVPAMRAPRRSSASEASFLVRSPAGRP